VIGVIGRIKGTAWNYRQAVLNYKVAR